MKITVVGAGVTGLALAYNLVKLGAGDVIVFEKKYIGYGSSTRSGARFRVHFWAEENTRFAINSVKLLERIGEETDWNPIIDHGGYLWLLSDEEELERFKKSNEMWRRLGVPGKFLEPHEVKERYPYIDVDGILAGFFGPQNGRFHHDYVCYGYLSNARKLGARIYEETEVKRIQVEGGRISGVETDKGFFDSDVVVLASGAWTNILLRELGISLPVKPLRKEVAITEPYRYFIDPLIIDTKTGAYVGQTLRGELLGSIDIPTEWGLIGMETRLKLFQEWAKAITLRIPILSEANLMRTWGGYYMVSRDSSHVMGRDPEWPEGLYVAYGYSGHGFMMAPLVGRLLAENILTGKVDELMRPFLPTRFKEGRLVPETLVIG